MNLQLCRSCAVALFAACLWFAPLAQGAERVEELARMLPGSCAVVICIKNTNEAIKDWDASGLSRFMEDPAAKKWMAPMYGEDGELSWNKSMRESTGESFRESLSVYPGAVAVGYDFSEMAGEDSKEPRFVAFSEIAGREGQLAVSKDKALEAKRRGKYPNIVSKTVEVGGTKVSVMAEDESEGAKWLECWAVVDGIAIEASDEKTMETALSSQKSGGEAGQKSEQLAHIAELNGGTADLTVHLDLTILIDLLKKKLAENSEGAAAMFSPAMFFDALALDELKAAALTLDFEDSRSSGSLVLLHTEKPKGILPALFRGTSTEVPQPAFLPESANQASVSRQSLGEFYDLFMAAVQKLGPMSAMLTMQLEQMERNAGVSLRNDLFGSLDDVVVQAQSMKAGSGGMLDMSQVTAIKLKDRARFQSALDALLASLGNGFVILEQLELEGRQIHALKLPALAAAAAPGTPPNSLQIAYTVADDYFLYSRGSYDTLQKILARLNSKATDGSIWEMAATQSALEALPKGYTGMSVSNGASLVKTMADALSEVQSMAGAGAAARGKAPRNTQPGAKGRNAAKAPGPGLSFDPKAVPGEDVFSRYFGVAAGGNYSGPDSTVFRIIALPAGTK